MAAIKGGTEEQILATYRETIGALYGYVSRNCGGDRTLAEDVTQETWLRAVREWRRNGLPARPIAWLTTVALLELQVELKRIQQELEALNAVKR